MFIKITDFYPYKSFHWKTEHITTQTNYFTFTLYWKMKIVIKFAKPTKNYIEYGYGII